MLDYTASDLRPPTPDVLSQTHSAFRTRPPSTAVLNWFRTRPPWTKTINYFLIVMLLMTFAYRVSTTVQNAMAQANVNAPSLLSATTLASGKYAATTAQFQALRNLEARAVADVIEDHGLDPGDVDAVKSWARADATAELWALLVQAIEKPAASRSTDEQHAVAWLTAVQQRQNTLSATFAGGEYVKWSALDQNAYQVLVDNPNTTRDQFQTFLSQNLHTATGGHCTYRSPAPYETEYTGYQISSCFVPCQAMDGCIPNPPSYDLFAKWGTALANPEFNSPEFVRMSRDVIQGIILGSTITGALVLGAVIATNTAIATALATSAFQFAVFPFAARVSETAIKAAVAAAKAAGASVKAAKAAVVAQAASIGGTTAAAGVAALVVIALIMIAIAVIALVNIIQAGELPGKLANGIINARDTVPDLPSMLSNSNQFGGLFSLFIGATMPLPRDGETCDNTVVGFGIRPCLNAPAIPAPTATDPIFAVRDRDAVETTYTSSIAHWNPALEATFTTRMHGNWFVHEVSAEDLDPDDPTGEPASVQALRIRYIDWDNKGHTAWLMPDPNQGYMFLSAADLKPGDSPLNPKTCVADGTCTYSSTINLIDKDGRQYSASVVNPIGPNVAPTYSANPTVNEPVTFTANGSSPQGLSVTYKWQFRAPGVLIPTCSIGIECDLFSTPTEGAQIQRTFDRAGNWQVRLTATDSQGQVTTSTFTLPVAGAAPPTLTLTPQFGLPQTENEMWFCILIGPCDNRVGATGERMRLTGSITHLGASDLVRIWVNWGDGSGYQTIADSPSYGELAPDLHMVRVPGAEPPRYTFVLNHTYAAPGNYTVTVTAEDPGGSDTRTALYVIQTEPTIEWPPPAPISYGTPLSAVQLNATVHASGVLGVPGSLTYSTNGTSIAPGDILPPGEHTLTATFTPEDTLTFATPDPFSVQLLVIPSPLTITAPSQTMRQGDATLPNIVDVNYDGFVNDEDAGVLDGTLTCALTNIAGVVVALSADLPVGNYMITCAGLTSSNYEIVYEAGTLLVLDGTAPVITPAVDGTLGNNGWYTSDVIVSWSIIDTESAITDSTGCDQTVVSADTTFLKLSCSATSEGGTADSSVTIKRDATPPVVTFTGNQETYGILDTIAIDCTASDATSGLASDTCSGVAGAAWTFAPGEHTFVAMATDHAGHEASAAARFTVTATYDALCTLTQQLVTNSSTATQLCQLLSAAHSAAQRGQEPVEATLLSQYEAKTMKAAEKQEITIDNANLLINWSRTL